MLDLGAVDTGDAGFVVIVDQDGPEFVIVVEFFFQVADLQEVHSHRCCDELRFCSRSRGDWTSKLLPSWHHILGSSSCGA